jgi:hypothetical protein
MANKSEIIKALTVLSAAYPRFELTDATVSIYVRLLADLDFELLKAATLQCATINTFFPSVAEIRAAAEELQAMAEGIPTEAEAWQNVLQQIGMVGSSGQPQFRHPLIEQVVRQFGWRNLCMSENQIADRARFMDVFEKLLRDTNRRNRMLPEIREIIDRRALTAREKINLLVEKVKVA